MTVPCKRLLNVGFLTLLAPVGLTVALVVLHLLGAVNAWVFPLVQVGAFCLFGGTGCIVAAQVLSRRPVPVSRPINHQRRRQLCWGLAILLFSLNFPPYLLAHHMTHVRSPGMTGPRCTEAQSFPDSLRSGGILWHAHSSHWSIQVARNLGNSCSNCGA
ncbi:hypothetical protein SPB21_14040 [Leptothoe sp. ISB3NOV94-8A]